MTGASGHQHVANRRSAAPMPGRSNEKRQPRPSMVMRFPRRFGSDPVTSGHDAQRDNTVEYLVLGWDKVLQPPMRRVAARWLRSSGRDATVQLRGLAINLSHRRSTAYPWLGSNGTGQPGCTTEGPKGNGRTD